MCLKIQQQILFNNLERFRTEKKFTEKVHVEELSLEVDGKIRQRIVPTIVFLTFFLCVDIIYVVFVFIHMNFFQRHSDTFSLKFQFVSPD